MHRVRWAALVRAGRLGEPDYTRLGLTPEDVSELSAAEERLLAVRSRLHLVAGSKRDRLPVDLAPALAAALGISTGTPGLAVERMLASLRRTMATVASIHEAVRRAVLSGLGYVPAAKVMAACVRLEPSGLALAEGADDLLPLLAASARSGLPLALSARRRLIAACETAPGHAAAPDFLDKLLAVLTAPKALTALEVMLETGYLGALLPELGAVADLVQFDGFHLFPLGEHTVPRRGPGRRRRGPARRNSSPSSSATSDPRSARSWRWPPCSTTRARAAPIIRPEARSWPAGRLPASAPRPEPSRTWPSWWPTISA